MIRNSASDDRDHLAQAHTPRVGAAAVDLIHRQQFQNKTEGAAAEEEEVESNVDQEQEEVKH